MLLIQGRLTFRRKASREKIDMGKIYKNFYPQIYDLFNLWLAFDKASKGRRSHPSIAAFEYHLEPELICLRDELREQTWRPGGYRSFMVHEPKRRKISAAPFRDRVVHHALMNVTGPMLETKFIFDSLTMSSFRIVVIARSVFCDEAIPSQTRRLLRFARSDKMRRVYRTRV
jgi:hypothetical protein